MAVAPPDSLIPQLAEALGLDPKRCRSIDLHMRTNDVLTVTATEYIDVEQAGRIIQLMRSRDYALVPREHYDRLVRHVGVIGGGFGDA